MSAVTLDIPVPKYVDSASNVSAAPAMIVFLGIAPSFYSDVMPSEHFILYNVRHCMSGLPFLLKYVNFFPNI